MTKSIRATLLIGLFSIFTVGAHALQNEETYVQQFRQENELHILNDFRDFLAIRNTAARPDDQQKNADWIVDYIDKRGFTSQIVRAGGAPYVIAEKMVPGATKTVLFYVHFDGQPTIPENWASPPFSPTLRAGPIEKGAQALPWPTKETKINPEWRLFARSAGDDKAPIIGIMAALDAMEASGVTPSINIKLILDGEEEKGSPTLKGILEKYGDQLASDLILFCDAPLHQSGNRQLVYGMRGSMTLEITAYGPVRPLHSGHYGNWAPNPNDTLMRALVGLKNEDGSIAVDGFYDDAPRPSATEKQAIAAMPEIDDQLKRQLGLADREQPNKRIEELVMEPAIVIKGFQGGGVERKSRNIIQTTAQASLNFRLVKNQTPASVKQKIETHFKKNDYHLMHRQPSLDIRREHSKILKLDWRPGAYGAFKTPLDGEESLKLVQILNEIDGKPTMQTPTLGGSLPIVLFEESLSAPIIVLPIANHDNNQHGRNENIRLQNLWDAIEIYAAVIRNYGLN